ncbi:DUF5654 family protein [Candidatus Pacearchaeota archaeon]|nr:DUF5654 family protein [Candidatus Pacearchaeota archaeon]
MIREVRRFFTGETRYAHEFWHDIRTLILFTLGFTIAFTWRQTVFDTMESFIQWLTNVHNTTSLSILTSLLTTLICVLVIAIMAQFFKNK